MNTLQILTLVGLVLFFVYDFFIQMIKTEDGLPPESLSATSYILQKKYGKSYSYLFTLMCIVVVGTFLPTWLAFSSEKTQFLAFLASAGVAFAGMTPFFREGLDKPIHYTSGAISAVCFVLWCIFNNQYGPLIAEVIGVPVMFLLYKSYKPWVFWLELFAIVGLGMLLIIYP